MRRTLPIVLLLASSLAYAQTPILPLKDVRAGMRGTGRTVFNGTKIEEFQVEILGVLENNGPKQSVILARLSGGPLEKAGVMQGMSGSPVYIDGKLVGAVALSFPYSKDPVAGIRPIEEMLQIASPAVRAAADFHYPFDPAAALPKAGEVAVGPTVLRDISTPLWLNGFSRNATEHFASALKASGLEPVQGISGGGKPVQAASPAQVQPGSMISVQLVSGDLSAGADGTVTYVDGRKICAFGHRFLSVGQTDLPFSSAEVLTVLASQNSSFKISTPREWLGTITQDRSTAIAGELGRKAVMIPVNVRVRSAGPGGKQTAYKMEMVDDRLFTPLLLQMVVYSVLDATERTVGTGTITLSGQLRLDGGPPITINNIFAAELGAPQMVSAAVAAPVAAVQQAGFESLRVRGLDIDMEVSDEKRQMRLDSAWASRREVRPGESMEISALFTGEHGEELVRTVKYAVPVGAPAGPLYFTVTDGPTANLMEYRQFLTTPPRSSAQLQEFLGGLHPSDRAYVRVWRQQPSWQVQGETLPSPPPSAALALSRSATQQAGSTITQIEMAPAAFQFAGSKTVQVEVRE